MTRLLALVSAPPLEAATVRHVEVLELQPQVMATVVITSTGGVTKRVFALGEPVDQGLVSWAGEYLNERTVGLAPGSRALRQVFAEPGLTERERAFLELFRPAFTHAAGSEEQRLFVGGTAMVLGDVTWRGPRGVPRAARGARAPGRRPPDPRRGARDARARSSASASSSRTPRFSDASLVGATYGLAHRRLGAVSLLGPLRMDYETAIRSVRGAARELSRFVEEIYAEN